MFVGVVHEANFGAVLACGAGGVTIELVKDVQVSLTPVSQNGVRELLGRLKTFPLLTGYRGSAPCDLDALVDLIVRIGTLADDLPQIAEIDFNPIRVGPAGVTIVDARVLLRPA